MKGKIRIVDKTNGKEKIIEQINETIDNKSRQIKYF